MKHINKLQLLFLIAVLLIAGCLLLILSQQDIHPQQADDIFYCGNAAYQSDSLSQPLHEAGEQLFKENCKSCHKIHEESVGPALSDVTTRRPKKWIYSFIHNSDSLIKSGDTMAVNLFNKFNKAQMTSFPTLTESEIDSLLLYIEAGPSPKTIACP